MKISAWAIRNPIPVTVLFLALALAGIVSYFLLAVKQFPDVSFPVVTVTVTQNGAAPAELETQVTRQVEDAVAGIAGVKHIQSTVLLGSSSTTVEFEIGEDEQKATDEVRSRVDQIRANLPRSIDEPIVRRIDVSDAPIATYAVAAPAMSAEDLSWFIDDTLSRRLQGLPGVARVTRIGGVNREINVTLDLDRMRALGLTAPQVNEALARFDVNAPGGRAEVGGREQTVRVLGEAGTIEALRALTVPTGPGSYVRLSDIASIGMGSAEQRGFARLDGRPVVGFQVNKTKESSDVAVEDEVDAALRELDGQRRDIAITKIISTVKETRDSYSATVHVLIEGMALAALVVWLFLRDWRSTAIAAVAMPLSLIPTFTFMLWLGFSLNVVTLLALTLVIGILVDDAIVEVENIEKRIERGETPYRASLIGADQIGLAVVATTMAIVVVFLPVSFMSGMAGQYFREFGLTVSVAVLFSLLVARLVTPLMAAYLLKPKPHAAERKPFAGRYRRALDWALDHRWTSVALGGLFFVGSLFLAAQLPTAFVPTQDPGFLYLQVEGPPGATADDMEEVIQRTTRLLQAEPDTGRVFAQIGSTASAGPDLGTGAGLRDGTITVVLKEDRALTTDEYKQRIRPLLRRIPDARVVTQGGFGTADVEIILASEDGDALEVAANRLQRAMRSVGVVSDVRTATPPPGPELIIRPRAAEAARLNVSSDTLAAIARVATIGDIDANVPKFSEGERRIPIRVQLPEPVRADLAQMGGLAVPTLDGTTAPLASVADLSFEAGPAEIQRFDRERRITVQADLNGGAQLGTALEQINRLDAMRNLPAGVRQAAYGEAEDLAQLTTSFGLAIGAGVLLILGVLILLFRSFFKPVTILSALPLSVGGAFAALLLTGKALSLPAMIGFLMLLGLAAKNSILLVEYAIEREREGVSQRDALIAACRERARPIVMTTLAMMAGMLPTALGLGEGAEFRQPMAIGVIGGLITSTALSLVLVPVVYEIVDDLEQWLAPRLGRLVNRPSRDDLEPERRTV